MSDGISHRIRRRLRPCPMNTPVNTSASVNSATPSADAPLGVVDGREEWGLVVSPGDLATVRDQTAPLATVGANSSARSTAPVMQALAQLSGTMLMLAEADELDHARAIHETIGRLLSAVSDGRPTARRPVEHG